MLNNQTLCAMFCIQRVHVVNNAALYLIDCIKEKKKGSDNSVLLWVPTLWQQVGKSKI